MSTSVSFASPAPHSPAAKAAQQRDDSSRPLAMLVEPDEKIRLAVRELLDFAGFRVEELARAGSMLEKIKRRVPSVLFVDAEMPETDIVGLIRVLSRCPATRPVRVIVAFPPKTDAMHITPVHDAGAFAMLSRPLKSRDVLKALIDALESSKCEREKLDLANKGKPPIAWHVESNNSLLVRQAACPFHDEPVLFDRYILRSNRIATESNPFDITVYKRAVGKAQFVNFHHLAVMVCPGCLFASNHADYFIEPTEFQEAEKPAAGRPIHSTTAISAITAASAARREIAERAGGLSTDLFTEDRSLTGVFLSYELAIACSHLLMKHSRDTVSNEPLRCGNYHLRMAHLHELAGSDPSLIDAQYQAAVPLIERAYTVSEGDHLFKAAYQMIALSLRFGQDKIAMQYLQQMVDFDRSGELPPSERASLSRYLPRARTAWEDRNERRA